MKKIQIRGFTLIELLVVIAIIGILTSVITVNLATSRQKARDGKRVSDIAQIQLLLEQVFDRCNKYPVNIANTGSLACTVNGESYSLSYFTSSIPTDNGTPYSYSTNANPATDYVLRAELEVRNDNVLVNSSDVDGTVYTVDCTDSPKFYYCVQSK